MMIERNPTKLPGIFGRFFLSCLVLLMATSLAHAQQAATTGDPFIVEDQLTVMLIPLDAEQLKVEAAAWQELLQNEVEELARVELGLLEFNARDDLSPEEQVQRQADMDRLVEIADRRTRIIKRLELVLDNWVKKVGLDDADAEPAEVQEIRRYVSAVNGLRSGVIDAATLLDAVWAWTTDKQGGIRVLKNFTILLGVVALFWFLGVAAAKAINKALVMSGQSSRMLIAFVRRNVPKVALAVGILAGLAFLDVNITPLVAMIGGASFVIAFALQDTLSNFASGAMIMIYSPFDEGDYVDVASIQGTVKSMTLVNTTISTIDNKSIVVPNNSIWGNVITNYTGVSERRVDLTFGIGYSDDVDRAEEILLKLAKDHPKTLDEPKPLIKLHELGDSSVNLICRPWVKTEDYWDVYWDLMRSVKAAFDENGISIPFPQRDVHIFNESPEPASQPVADNSSEQAPSKTS